MYDCFVSFNPESFQLSRNKSKTKLFETVKYPFIHCLNMYKESSLYFKSKQLGYVLLFDEESNEKGRACYNNLLLMQDQNMLTKKKLKIGQKI